MQLQPLLSRIKEIGLNYGKTPTQVDLQNWFKFIYFSLVIFIFYFFKQNHVTWVLQNRPFVNIMLYLILNFLCIKSVSLPYPWHVPFILVCNLGIIRKECQISRIPPVNLVCSRMAGPMRLMIWITEQGWQVSAWEQNTHSLSWKTCSSSCYKV